MNTQKRNTQKRNTQKRTLLVRSYEQDTFGNQIPTKQHTLTSQVKTALFIAHKEGKKVSTGIDVYSFANKLMNDKIVEFMFTPNGICWMYTYEWDFSCNGDKIINKKRWLLPSAFNFYRPINS